VISVRAPGVPVHRRAEGSAAAVLTTATCRLRGGSCSSVSGRCRVVTAVRVSSS
jgi:hypothetical protein